MCTGSRGGVGPYVLYIGTSNPPQQRPQIAFDPPEAVVVRGVEQFCFQVIYVAMLCLFCFDYSLSPPIPKGARHVLP